VHVHVINLDRSPDRLAEFRSVNRHLAGLSRAVAFDGSKLDLAELERQRLISADIRHPDYYSVGGVGLAVSQIALWDLAIATGTVLTMTEDDAIFHSRFDACAQDVIKTLPADWDLIMWGFNFDLFMCFEMLPGVSSCLGQFEQDRMRAGIGVFQQQPIAPQAFRLIWAFGALCYSVSPKGAQALKDKCLPLRPMMIIDIPEAARAYPYSTKYRTVGLDNSMCAVYRHLNAFVCFPPLVISKNEACPYGFYPHPQDVGCFQTPE
jgi:GR25 family glycosyltransferase involved in LPS biosynthesis